MNRTFTLACIGLLASTLLPPGPRAQAQSAVAQDCSTPRRALLTWLGNLQSDNDYPRRAATCFQWRQAGVSAREHVELSRKLKAVLDQRGHYVDVEAIPDVPEVDSELLEHGRLQVLADLPELTLVHDAERWLISAETINEIEVLHGQTFDVDVESFVQQLPDWMRGELLPSLQVWQLLMLFAGLLLGLLIRALVARFVATQVAKLIQKQSRIQVDPDVVRRVGNPLGTLALTGVLWWVLPLLRLGVRFNQIAGIGLRVMSATATVILLYRLVDLGSDVFARRAAKTDTKLDDQIVPLIRKTLKVFVVAVGIIFILQNMDVDVGSLLAGVSLGGLAFTLAARDTVANLFGSVSIFADQPFQVGDWVLIEKHEGVVEEVGMRSTRIRTFRDSMISLPNSVVANAAVENYGLRRRRRVSMTLGLTYDSSADQIQAFCEGVRAILRGNKSVFQESYEVVFREFGTNALEVMVYFFLEVDTWTQELAERANIMLEIKRLAEAVQVEFAFPTQTLHLQTQAAPQPAPSRATPTRDELAEVIVGFGPGGETAMPTTPMITAGGFMPGAAIPHRSKQEKS